MALYGEGRPRKHTDNASKQRAYRARKAAQKYKAEIEKVAADQRPECDGYGFGGGVGYDLIKKLSICGLIEKRPSHYMWRVTAGRHD